MKRDFITKIEDILKKIFSFKYIYIIFFIIIGLYLFYTQTVNKTEIEILKDKYSKSYIILSIIAMLIFCILFIINNKLKKIEIHKKYLIIALILGTTYLFASPIFSQSDESFHFLRAYQVSMGHFVSPTDQNGNSYDYLPKSLYETLYDNEDAIYPEYKKYSDAKNEIKIKLNVENTVGNDMRAANYIFLNYIPSAIGIEFGKLLKLSPYLLGLFGRITNMLVCIMITYYALKIIPICKKTLTIFLIGPTVLAYTASMSADGLVISMTMLFVSIIIKYIHEKKKLNWKNYIFLVVILSFISTCKAAYLPVAGLLILLPYENFKNKKDKWIYTLSLIMIAILMSFCWLTIGNVSVNGVIADSGISKYTRFISLFITTYMSSTINFIENIFAGNYMYQCQVRPYEIIPFAYMLITLISIFSEEKNIKIRYIDKLIVILISLAIVILISYALYGANTSITDTIINGIQGRYFIPIIIMIIPFVIPKQKINTNITNLINISLILNLYVILNMIYVFI